jgi:hypothetical protein
MGFYYSVERISGGKRQHIILKSRRFMFFVLLLSILLMSSLYYLRTFYFEVFGEKFESFALGTFAFVLVLAVAYAFDAQEIERAKIAGKKVEYKGSLFFGKTPLEIAIG